MQPLHDLAQTLLQILSNPAWSGISSICALIGIPLAIHLARRTPTPQRQLPARNFKKNLEERPVASTSSTRVLIKDGTHKALLIKDLDFINSTSLNRLVSPELKKNGQTSTNKF